MAKTVEEMQDIALRQMEKINRRNRETSDSVSLASQLEKEKKWNKMSLQEKLKSLSRPDWNYQFKKFLDSKKTNVGDRMLNWVTQRYKKQFDKFHEEGTPFSEVLEFVQSKHTEFING